MKWIIPLAAVVMMGCVGSSGVPSTDTPTPDVSDSCLGKGAVGVMKIMTGQECEKDEPKSPPVVPAECGNKIIETGEACDGNPNCSDKCTWLTPPKTPPTSSNSSVTIKTKTLDVAYQGELYSDYIEATCKPTPCNFALKSGTTLPKNFSINAIGKLISNAVVADLGDYPVSIVVQNKDGSQSATQDVTLTVKKHLNIRTFVEGFIGFEVVDRVKDNVLNKADFDPLADYSDSQSFIPITSAGKVVVWPSHYSDTVGCVGEPSYDLAANDCRPEFGWIVLGVNFKDPIDVDLSANSDADAKAIYTWSIKGTDGKDLPGVVVDKAYSGKMGKQVGYMYFIEPSFDLKNHPENFKKFYEDLSFKNVKISVSDDKGNSGELVIGELVFIAPLLTKAEIDKQKKDAFDADPCNKLAIAVTKVTANEGEANFTKPVDVTLDKTVVVKFSVTGGKQPGEPILTSDVATPETTGYGADSSYLWQQKKDIDDAPGQYTYQRTFRYGTKALTESAVTDDYALDDTLAISVTDPACSKPATKPMVFKVHYPSISDSPPSPMRIRFGIGANDTDGDYLTMRIMDDDNKSLYGSFAVGGQSSLSLNPVGDGKSGCDEEGDDTYCNTAEDATLDPINGAIVEGHMPTLMTHSKLYFHVDTVAADDVGQLDVRFHSINVYGRYWYATFGDTGGSYDNITSNEQSDDTSEGTYDSSLGKLSWHRICVPNYDDGQKYDSIKFHCPK